MPEEDRQCQRCKHCGHNLNQFHSEEFAIVPFNQIPKGNYEGALAALYFVEGVWFPGILCEKASAPNDLGFNHQLIAFDDGKPYNFLGNESNYLDMWVLLESKKHPPGYYFNLLDKKHALPSHLKNKMLGKKKEGRSRSSSFNSVSGCSSPKAGRPRADSKRSFSENVVDETAEENLTPPKKSKI